MQKKGWRHSVKNVPLNLKVTRILEKQNSLRVSQVFTFACIGDQMGLAFQGFYGAAWEAAREEIGF